VSSKEKQFMVLWNAFMHRRNLYADYELPSVFFDFVIGNFAAIQNGGFRLELLCLMMTLCVAPPPARFISAKILGV
jgi:hypothetical protein